MTKSRFIRVIIIVHLLLIILPWNIASCQNIFSNLVKDQGQITDFLSVDSLSNSVSQKIGSEIWFKSLDINKDDIEGFYNRAISKVKQAYFKEAIIDLNKIIQIDTSISSAYALMGYCQLMLNNSDSTEYNLNKAIRLDSENATAYYARGRFHFSKYNFQSAKSDFKKALEINKNDPATPYFLGIIAFSERDVQTAKTYFKKSIEIDPTFAEPYIGLCSVYASAGQKVYALKTLDDASKYLEGNSNYYIVRAYVQYLFGNFPKAVDEFTNCLMIDSLNYQALLTRGIIYVLQNNYSAGYSDIKKALTENTHINKIPVSDEIKESFFSRTISTKQHLLADSKLSANSRRFYQSGYCKYITGNYNAALSDFQRIIEVENHLSEPLELRGKILMNLGELAKAEKDFEDALQFNGGNFFTYLNLARINYEENDIRKINKYLISSLKFEPDNPEIYKILASLNSTNPAVAISYYNKVLELQPNNYMILLTTARIKKDNGFLKDAIIDYERLISIDPDNREFYLIIAELEVSLNELDSAINTLEDVSRIDSSNYEPFLMLARIYSYKKDYNMAESYYKKAIQRNSSSYIALELCIQYEYQKKFHDAIYELNNVLKLIKKEFYKEKIVLANTYYHIGICYDSISEMDKAFKNYNLAIEENPIDPAYYNSRGNVYKRMKKYDLSKNDYLKSIEIDTLFYMGYISIGLLHLETSEIDLAISIFKRASEINPDSSIAFLELSKIYFSKSDFSNSSIFASIAYQKDNSSAESLYYQSMSELNKGETEQSKKTFQNFIELNCKTKSLEIEKVNEYLDSISPENAFAIELKQILNNYLCI